MRQRILTELVHLDKDPEMLERERKAELAAKRKRKGGGPRRMQQESKEGKEVIERVLYRVIHLS